FNKIIFENYNRRGHSKLHEEKNTRDKN
ncbi:MAG: hypothetical protein JWO32_153, partial [Bacteroidetes bacterium]|nr:hypothetical protein [Bacteroidota bacterium]